MTYDVQNLQDYCIYAGHFLAYRKSKSYVNYFLGKWSDFARKLGIADTFLAMCLKKQGNDTDMIQWKFRIVSITWDTLN